jgi:hypothetical protein
MNIQNFRQYIERITSRVYFSQFNPAHLRIRHVGPIGKFFDRNLLFISYLANIAPNVT